MAARSVSSQKSPAIKVDLLAAELAPELSPQKLQKFFMRAWQLVPAKRRPDTAGERRLAVDVHLINDAQIAGLNQAHMKHSGPTDVLSFTMSELDPERRAFNLGEIVVSFETARREAAARNITVEEELIRYCVHGFLHLLGYEDDTTAKRKAMFEVQEKVLES